MGVYRTEIPTTGHIEEVVTRDDGRTYGEQTRVIRGGTLSRRTGTYPSRDAYHDDARAGRLRWGRWE